MENTTEDLVENTNENKTDWIIELSSDSSVWSDELIGEGSVWPAPIVFNYKRLRDMMKQGNVYGSILQIKDLHEMILKISVITALIYLDEKFENELLDETDIVDKLMQKKFAFGDWTYLATEILLCSDQSSLRTKKRKRKEAFQLPIGIANVLYYTEILVGKEVGQYPNVSNWRNDTIGHGMIRFEDDEEYKIELRALLENLKEYFSGPLNEVYKNLYFSYGNQRFVGDSNPLTEENPLKLIVGDEIIKVCRYSIRCFFFDTFRYNQREIKYLNYFSGKEDIESIEMFSNYLAKYDIRVKMEEDVARKKRIWDSEEKMYSCLISPDKYQVPSGLESALQEYIDSKDKGIITLCMNRGTGKTAFAYSVDGINGQASQKVFPRMVVRSYSIGTLVSRGINDFFGYMKDAYTKTRTDHSRSSSEDDPRISLYDENPKQAMADLLNYYRDIYEETFMIDTLVLIIDGIDELTEETSVINKWLLDSRDIDLLDDGIFIIYTSRFEDECEDSRATQNRIREKVVNSDKVIEISRESDINKELLRNYVKTRNNKMSDEEIDVLLERTEYRFLYLKVYIQKNGLVIPDTVHNSAKDVIRLFIDSLLSRYNEMQRSMMLRLLACFGTYGRIGIQDYIKYFLGETITYRFIGIINDLQPILTSVGDNEGRKYELANEEYMEYVRETYRDEIIEFGKRLQTVFVREKNRIIRDLNDVNIEDLCNISEAVACYKKICGERLDGEFIRSCLDFMEMIDDNSNDNRYYSNLVDRLSDCMYFFVPDIPGCDYIDESYYRLPDFFMHGDLLIYLYNRDPDSFIKMMDNIDKNIDEGINQWNIMLLSDSELDLCGEEFLNLIYPLYKKMAKHIIEDDQLDYVLEKVSPSPELFGSYYYHFLYNIYDNELPERYREKVLNYLAFTCIVSRNRHTKDSDNADKYFDIIEGEDYKIIPPFDNYPWTYYYDEHFHKIDNVAKKRADMIYEFHKDYIKDNKMGAVENSPIRMLNLPLHFLYDDIKDEYIKEILNKISKMYYDEIDDLLAKKAIIPSGICDMFYSRLNDVDVIYGDKGTEKLIEWIEGFKNQTESYNYLLKELYYKVIVRMGEEAAIEYYDEYVYSLDGINTYLSMNGMVSDCSWREHDNLKGVVICSENSVDLMSLYYIRGDLEKARQLCRDIYDGDKDFIVALIEEGNLYKMLEYQNNRLFFWYECRKDGFLDIISGFSGHFIEIIDYVIKEISGISKETDDFYILHILDDLFFLLFKYGYYKMDESFACIRKTREKLADMNSVSDKWTSIEINYADIYMESIESLFNFMADKATAQPGSQDKMLNYLEENENNAPKGLLLYDYIVKLNSGVTDKNEYIVPKYSCDSIRRIIALKRNSEDNNTIYKSSQE